MIAGKKLLEESRNVAKILEIQSRVTSLLISRIVISRSQEEKFIFVRDKLNRLRNVRAKWMIPRTLLTKHFSLTQQQLWQQRTEDTISKLSRTSQDVAAQLEDSAQKQLLVLEKQNTSLENQRKIISNEIQLSETLRTSTLNAKKAFEDMKQSAVEQRALFSETFDSVFKSMEKVRKLQSMILGEFISLQSVAFYVAAVCIRYFLTSTPRTAGARLPLFIGLFVLIFLEWLVTFWGVTDSQSTDTMVKCAFSRSMAVFYGLYS